MTVSEHREGRLPTSFHDKELQHYLCQHAAFALVTLFEAILVSRRRRLAMKTFIIALILVG
jgi:hypothetical protein